MATVAARSEGKPVTALLAGIDVGTTNREVGVHSLDGTAVVERRWLAERVGRVELLATTGVDVAVKTPLANWLWLRRHRPDVVGSGADDQFHDRYSDDLLALAGVRATQLPGQVTGTTTGGPLPVGTTVVVAGHDHLVAAYAAGARGPGDVVDSLGTAEAVVTVSERVAPRTAAGSGMSWNRTADGTRWAMVSGFPHCGRLLDWLRSLSSPAGDLARLEKVAESVATHPDRRLAVHGRTPGQAPPDVIVASLEGACYHARRLAEHHAEHAGTALGDVSVLGGPSRGTAWLAAKTHVKPGAVRMTATPDAACAEAALLAGDAVGLPVPVLRSDVRARDDILADRYDAIYRGEFLPRVREVA